MNLKKYAIVYRVNLWHLDDYQLEVIVAQSHTDAINDFLSWSMWKTRKPHVLRCVYMEDKE